MFGDSEDDTSERTSAGAPSSAPVTEEPTTTTQFPLMVGRDPSLDPEQVVIFEVEGTTDRASLTFTGRHGISQQDVAVPLRSKAPDGSLVPGIATGEWDSGSFVSISAQNQRDSGVVTCRISLGDGTVLSEITSRGAYVIASCDAIVP